MKPSISMLLLRPLFAALDSPAKQAEWMRSCGVSGEQLADHDARVTAQQFHDAWAELLRQTGDAQIALKLAAAIPVGTFGLVEYVCRASATLGEALRQWLRYLNLLDDAVLVGIEEQGDRIYLRVVRDRPVATPASHELCFAVLFAQTRSITTEPFQLLGVEFAHAAPASTEAYARSFGAQVRFGAKETQMVFPASAFALPLRSADPNLLAILERSLGSKHDGARVEREPPSMSARIRSSLLEALRTNRYDIVSMARSLAITPRKLQRALKEEGTSFNAIRDELRYTLASRYLDEGLSIAEISFLLGFSEPSAFFRAFKRWSGTTPIESRTARHAPS
jgi:AraC-like DNA-binding protein